MPEEAAEKVVELDSTPAEEVVTDEPVDIVALLNEGEEEVKPVLDKKDKAIIKFKQRDKQSRRELDDVKKQLAELQRKDAERSLSKPDPEQYDGVDDPKYAEDLEDFITRKAGVSMEDQIAKRIKEERETQRQDEHRERLESVVRDNQERVNEEIIKHAETRPEFKASLESSQFMETLAEVPLAITAKIAKSKDAAIILEYYSKNPTRFANLAANDPDEILNLGVKMGQIKSIKAKTTEPNVIKPLQGGDNTSKRDPIKDYDKYRLPDGTHDTNAWRKDMFGTK
jgi:hypothetical protein